MQGADTSISAEKHVTESMFQLFEGITKVA